MVREQLFYFNIVLENKTAMKKICIDIPETRKEAIDLLVKASVSDDDIDNWLIRSKKEHTLSKLKMFQGLVNDYGSHVHFVSPAEFDEIAHDVEKQVIELIVGFEE